MVLALPVAFKAKYLALLGETEGTKFLKSFSESPQKAFRLNPLKANFDQVHYSLDQPVPSCDFGYYGKISDRDSEWVSGMVYSQEPSAMFAAQIAQVKPGNNVLDLCAAPGGKSTVLAQALHGKGVLVANEISQSRARVLRENLERWGVSNAIVTNEAPERLATHFKAFFDCILVDAPCSGEGMFRKNPNAITYWSSDYVLYCQKRQHEILEQALKMLKPGGELIYATCTFSPQEDEQVVEWLVQDKQLKILPINLACASKGRPEWGQTHQPELSQTVRFWTQNGIGEGQYMAHLKSNEEKIADSTAKRDQKQFSKNNRLTRYERQLVLNVLNSYGLPETVMLNHLMISKQHVFIPVMDPQMLDGLHVLSNGIEVGLLKKNRFEPSHQLAEVLGQKKQANVYDLPNQQAYEKYLHGETLPIAWQGRGFVLISFHHQIFSFGKIGADQILKNFYPKGLRQ